MPDVHLKDATEYPRRVAWVAGTAPTTGALITVGPGTLWIDTSSTPFVWKVRNIGDTGWDTVGVAGTPTSIANAGGSVVINGSGNIVGVAAGGGEIAAIGGGAAIFGSGWAAVQANADDSIIVAGGPSGAAHVDIHASGEILIQPKSGEQLKLNNVPTSNPGGTGNVWNDSGTLKVT
jgi:hypothetical protein